jgi:hypothetical protein
VRRFVGPACAIAVAGAACRSGHGASIPDAGEHSATRARGEAIDPPEGLLLEASLRDPDGAWSRLQQGAGGTLAVLPPTLGQLACTWLGVAEDLGALVDGHATAHAVVVQRSRGSGTAGAVGWAVSLRLSETGARQMGMPTAASRAGFSERVERGIHVLSRDPPLPAAIGIAQGWLIVARDERDLLESGPYLVRTLAAPVSRASRAPSASLVAMVPHGALVGPIAAALSSSWESARAWLLEQGRSERERHRGRQPDFGDPDAIVAAVEHAAEGRLAAIADARALRIEAETGTDDVTVDVRAVTGDERDASACVEGDASACVEGDASACVEGDASACVEGDASASTPLGDARPLGEAPADSSLALLFRDDVEERVASVQGATATLAEVLGSRLSDLEARTVDAALEAWSRARGDWMAVGMGGAADEALGGASAGAFWIRAPAASEASASRAIRQVLELSRLPPLRAPMAQWLHRQPVVFGSGPSSTATFPPVDEARQTRAGAAGAAWEVRGGVVTIALGALPLERLAGLTSSGSKWADDARTARVLAALGPSTRFVALVQPLRLAAGQRVASAPLALAWGRQEGDPWVRLDVADELLVAGVRLAGATAK